MLSSAQARKRPASVPKQGRYGWAPGTLWAMPRGVHASVLLLVLVLSFGCENDSGDHDGHDHKNAPSGTAELKELKKTDQVVGKGGEAAIGDLVFVTYTGKLKNGTTFDSNNKSTANPLSFVLGAGSVIKGWDQGVVGMRVGGKRKLEVPASLAYGSQSPPGSTIPANSDLYFDVELLDMVKKGEENTYDKTELKVGAGTAAANGDTVTIHYVGKLVNGRQFDSTYERKKSETFTLGKGEVVQGLEAGIIGMKPGGKRKIRIPPNIGYGPYGMGHVPGNSITVFEVELLKVKKG